MAICFSSFLFLISFCFFQREGVRRWLAIWRNSVIFWDCLRRPPPDAVPHRPRSRPSHSPQSRCCMPLAADAPQPAPPSHLGWERREIRLWSTADWDILNHAKHTHVPFQTHSTCNSNPPLLRGREHLVVKWNHKVKQTVIYLSKQQDLGV